MTGSMYAAVSGLKAHMSALNVIGNNVSNVNTLGYKATRYTFNEALYTTTRSGSDGTATAGGRNPAQIGFGASIGTIDIDMSTKNYTPTGWGLDTMIDGDGFFIVGDKVVGADDLSKISLNDLTTLKAMNLTRLGRFNIDPNGFLVDGNGQVVWGFAATQTAKAYNLKTGAAVDVEVDATTGKVTLPADAVTAGAKLLTDMTADDIKTLNSARKKAGLPELTNIEYTEKVELDDAGKPKVDGNGDPVYVKDNNGNVIMVVKSASVPSTDLSPMRMPVLKTTTVMEENKDAKEGEDKYFIPNNPTVRKEVIWVDPNTLADGAEVGTLETIPKADETLAEGAEACRIEYTRLESDSVTIDEKTGALRVMTSDGTLYTVGYIAIAKVTNPNGVTHVDGRYYQAQGGAGTIRVTSVGGAVAGVETSGDTELITGGLESSGTDLATEITNMITVQRGYQANTRIVTVTDTMLEELVNMKR